MTRRHGTLVAIAVAAGLAGFALARWSPPPTPRRPPAEAQLWTCGMHPQVLRHEPGFCPLCGMALTPVADGGAASPHATAITIDPVVVQNMGVRVAPVTTGPLRTTIRAAGTLMEAEPRRHDVSLRVSGWIDRLYADTVGMHLAAGAPLFELFSPELQVAVDELIATRGAGDTPLGRAAAQKLRQLGLDDAQIARLARLEHAPRTVTITSPASGHLIDSRVVAGSAVQAGQQVLRIVDHSVLWLDAQVFEQDLPLVAVGQDASATFRGRPGERFAGTVVFVHPHVDPMTRGAAVRIELPNPGFALRPGMYATVEIAVELAADAVQVPREAVIDTGVRQVAFVALDGGRFEPRTLVLGARGADGNVAVRSGLAPGEVVVTSGQFLLDAESRFREAIAKYRADGLETKR